MKITNQAQAIAAAECQMHRDKALEIMAELGAIDLSEVRAALADWNERKELEGIVLSDHEKIMLDYSLLSRGQCKRAIASLEDKGFVVSSDESDFVCDSTPKGRAYLEAQKQPTNDGLINGRDVEWDDNGTIKVGVYIGAIPFDKKYSIVIPLGHGWHSVVVKTADLKLREVK